MGTKTTKSIEFLKSKQKQGGHISKSRLCNKINKKKAHHM
jgi:hypothetical protein